MARCRPRMAAPVRRTPSGRSGATHSSSSSSGCSCPPGTGSSPTPPGYGASRGSEVAATRLLALDGLEQGLEVAGPEAPRPLPLDDLEEQGGAVGDGLGEDLEEVAVL